MTNETCMELAIIEAGRCVQEKNGRPHPKVGAVATKNGVLLDKAYRGEFSPGDHAEYTLLERKLKDVSIAGATVYTTLEPCTSRNHPKIPCVERLIERKVRKVVIGQLDPNPAIRGAGILTLRNANIDVDLFPSGLACRLEEMNREFARSIMAATPRATIGHQLATASDATREHGIIQGYRETAYDALGGLYDLWYGHHWSSEEPYLTLLAIMRQYHEAKQSNLKNLRILDCACGTGNAYATFRQKGYDIYGTDGSREMLMQAKRNCDLAQIPTDQLILAPINWTDGVAFENSFGTEQFDVIINTGNSLCHMPPVPEYMGSALMNFHRLLRPGGLLIVDTKRYIQSDPEDGVRTYRELRHIADQKEWIVRSERVNENDEVPHYGKLTFHTRLKYDYDPSFGEKVRRALIVLTIYGTRFSPRVFVIPYYPLPAQTLQEEMGKVGLTTSILEAMKDIVANWKYDVVVGRKPK